MSTTFENEFVIKVGHDFLHPVNTWTRSLDAAEGFKTLKAAEEIADQLACYMNDVTVRIRRRKDWRPAKKSAKSSRKG